MFKSLVRPHIEYCASVWSPHYIKDKFQIEQVQRRFTKMILELRNFSYKTRLKKLNLDSRRTSNRADAVEVFKMFSGISAVPFQTFFQLDSNNRTRGPLQKLRKTDAEGTDLRKHFFSDSYSICWRHVNRWNSLKQETTEATYINTFKRFLEKERETRMDLFMD